MTPETKESSWPQKLVMQFSPQVGHSTVDLSEMGTGRSRSTMPSSDVSSGSNLGRSALHFTHLVAESLLDSTHLMQRHTA